MRLCVAFVVGVARWLLARERACACVLAHARRLCRQRGAPTAAGWRAAAAPGAASRRGVPSAWWLEREVSACFHAGRERGFRPACMLAGQTRALRAGGVVRGPAPSYGAPSSPPPHHERRDRLGGEALAVYDAGQRLVVVRVRARRRPRPRQAVRGAAGADRAWQSGVLGGWVIESLTTPRRRQKLPLLGWPAGAVQRQCARAGELGDRGAKARPAWRQESASAPIGWMGSVTYCRIQLWRVPLPSQPPGDPDDSRGGAPRGRGRPEARAWLTEWTAIRVCAENSRKPARSLVSRKECRDR
jgi:hypothetical protein